MWEVRLGREAEKTLKRLMPEIKERVLTALAKLRSNPFPIGIEKLKTTNEWRLRVGDYRIIYRVDEKRRIVEVSEIGHRRDVYRGR